MGVCCVASRKNLEESSTIQKPCFFERADVPAPLPNGYRVKKLEKHVTIITQESFRTLTDCSISKIYKRDGSDIKCMKSFLQLLILIVCIDPFWHIYPVVHVSSGALGLMKVIKKSQIEKRIGWDNFCQNLALQKDLDHPHVAKIHELYQDDSNCYIIYE